VLAILGASGSGKTTLLNVLAGRAKNMKLKGNMKVNGVDVDVNKNNLGNISGYVLQDDLLLPQLTVKETLEFSANLRLPEDIDTNEKQRLVQSAIQELGLKQSANTRIGSPLRRGISGGERKRVSIGTEIITDPSLVFLDEPTSGLDSFTAQNIMQTLVQMANAGRTVICTIHQPRSNIFALFDMLLVLGQGGRVAYFGPASSALEYFSALGYDCPNLTNPADFLLDVTSVDPRTPESEKETSSRLSHITEEFPKTKFASRRNKIVAKLANAPSDPDVATSLIHSGYAASISAQFKHLFWRSFNNFYRDKFVLILRLIQTLIFSLLIGLIYLNIDDDQTSITDRVGVLFFILINQAFGGLFSALNSFPSERAVYLKERASRMYRVEPYYITKGVSEFPGLIFFPLVFSVIVYWMIGLNSGADRFFLFVVIVVETSFISNSIGLMISATVRSEAVAQAIAPVVLIVFLLFGGFYVNTANIPPYFIWLEWISFVKYGFNGLMRNEMEGLTFTCNPSSPNACLSTGEDVLALYGLDDPEISVGTSIIALAICIVVFRFLGYLGLKYVAKSK
jgi:ABC-type multidrug transport system ATPase subunit